jgi:glycyl-tRNA synthetase alpha subunit
MTESQFQTLSYHDKGVVVFCNGKFISNREYYQQKISLYSVYDFHVEVYYGFENRKINKFQIVQIDDLSVKYSDKKLTA